MFTVVATQAASSGCGRVLMDFRDMVGQLSQYDEGFVGQLAAQHLRALKCAFVIQQERRTGVVPAHALQGGLQCKSFADEGKALAWLQED